MFQKSVNIVEKRYVRSILFLGTFLLGLIFFGCQPKQNHETAPESSVFDEEKETAAIMAVIKNETTSFFNGDYDSWVNNWSHSQYAAQAWNNSDGTSDAAVGWDAIHKQGKNWIETYYKNGKVKIHPVYKTTKPLVTIFGNDAAYLIWTQYNADTEKKFYRLSHESRIMQKEKEQWKIVNVSAFWDVDPKISADSLPKDLL